MSIYQQGTTPKAAVTDPSLPAGLPKVDKLGTTSAPLKSASSAIAALGEGQYEDTVKRVRPSGSNEIHSFQS
jgi:hypothetical protein